MKILYLFIVAGFFLSNIHASKHKSRNQSRDEKFYNTCVTLEKLIKDHREIERRHHMMCTRAKKIFIAFGSTMGVLSAIAICDIFKINPLFLLTKAFTKQPTT